jgi:hypothetical protein
MKTVIAKYPIKIGNVLVPKGAVGEIVDIEEVRQNFPHISYKLNSKQISVSFLGLKPCIVHLSQLTFEH